MTTTRGRMIAALAATVSSSLILAGCGAAGSTAERGHHAGHRTRHSSHFTPWDNFHRTASKSGVATAGVSLPLHHAWTKRLSGSVWSEPILAHGLLVAATEHNVVYGLNPKNGHKVWKTSLGAPEPGGDEPCGDIDPIGITGSPAYDPKTKSVFVVTTTGDGKHTLWALNINNGHRRWHRNADRDTRRDPNAEQQRAALLVLHNRVIVTYGAHAGDCGNYSGYAFSAATDGKGRIPYYAVPHHQSGMWGPAGPVEAYDGNILTPTANGSNRNPDSKWDHSDGVIELTPKTMQYVRGWAPGNWEQGDADDLSLGSTSPVRVAGDYVVGGKRGEVWLLKQRLGGVNGQLDTLGGDNYCNAFGGIAAKGDLAILPCKNFSGNPGMLAVTVRGNKLHPKWYTRGLYGSAIIAGRRAFVADLDSGRLKVLSLRTGSEVASIAVGSLPTFPSEVVDGNHVFVPTLSGITAVRGSSAAARH